jgi:hypothetical protein
MIPLLPILAALAPSVLLAVYDFGHRHGYRDTNRQWRGRAREVAERRRRAVQEAEEAWLTGEPWWVGRN